MLDAVCIYSYGCINSSTLTRVGIGNKLNVFVSG
jgi:hypothetical protein